MRLTLLILLMSFSAHLVGASAKIQPQSVQAFFSPSDRLADRLCDLIDMEEKSIHVAIYCLTHRDVANALIEAKKRGVDVQVIVDPFSVKIRSPLKKMIDENIPVYVWDPQMKKRITKDRKFSNRHLMHDKFCVFNGEIVWTGSFNFTYDAHYQHQENAVVLESDALAKAYEEEFEYMKSHGCRKYEEFTAIHPKKKIHKSKKK